MPTHMGREIWFCPVGEALSPEGIAPQLPKIQNIHIYNVKNRRCFIVVLTFHDRKGISPVICWGT